MIDREYFEEQVHEALAHLYDHVFLQDHPLARSITIASAPEEHGRALRRLLLDAIQDLKPPREAPLDSSIWRHYQYLYLRYVEAKPVAEIAEGLAVSERQTRRWHRDALSALTRRLWVRWCALVNLDPAAGNDWSPSLPSVAAIPARGSLLEIELERIKSAQPGVMVDILEVIDGVRNMVAPLARERATDISFTRPDAPVTVVGDRVILRQAITSALVYAVRQVTGSRIDISVIAEMDQSIVQIRADRPAREMESQEGISRGDFAEVERLLQGQKNSLGITSDGCCLIIQIRLLTAQPTTVLVVDDNPDMLGLFRRYLRGTPFRLVEASSGDLALDLAVKIGPACIILDVMMPIRDGWETLQVLRSHHVAREVPLIICSVLRQQELALSLGATEFLAKPITQRSLLEALRRCCGADR